jgi:hypothetical protein
MSRFCIALALTLCLSGTVATAQSPSPPALVSTVFSQQVSLGIYDGRLFASPHGQVQQTFNTGNRQESITVMMTENGLTVDDDIVAPNDKLSVHLQSDGQVTAHRELIAAASTNAVAPTTRIPTIVDYRQLPSEPVSLTVTENGETKRIAGDTIWHVMLLEPELCQRHLVPMLELLRANWQLQSMTADLKQALVKMAAVNHGPDRRKWAGFVAQLGDSHYSVRQRAERELRGAGQPALAYLQGLRRKDLDAEQWQRVTEIIESYSEDREDSAERIAPRLLEDRAIWIAFLADEQESVRQAALAQLRTLIGQNLDFDPASSAEVRTRQLAALRAKYLPKN